MRSNISPHAPPGLHGPSGCAVTANPVPLRVLALLHMEVLPLRECSPLWCAPYNVFPLRIGSPQGCAPLKDMFPQGCAPLEDVLPPEDMLPPRTWSPYRPNLPMDMLPTPPMLWRPCPSGLVPCHPHLMCSGCPSLCPAGQRHPCWGSLAAGGFGSLRTVACAHHVLQRRAWSRHRAGIPYVETVPEP